MLAILITIAHGDNDTTMKQPSKNESVAVPAFRRSSCHRFGTALIRNFKKPNTK
jgi:hypothetical protein